MDTLWMEMKLRMVYQIVNVFRNNSSWIDNTVITYLIENYSYIVEYHNFKPLFLQVSKLCFWALLNHILLKNICYFFLAWKC